MKYMARNVLEIPTVNTAASVSVDVTALAYDNRLVTPGTLKGTVLRATGRSSTTCFS